jgi:hypothetical protein
MLPVSEWGVKLVESSAAQLRLSAVKWRQGHTQQQQQQQQEEFRKVKLVESSAAEFRLRAAFEAF